MNRALVAGLCALLAACSAHPDVQQHFEAGRRLLREGRPADAVTAFQAALATNDRWPEARYLLAEAYEASGDFEHAYRAYIRAADLLPDDATAQLKAAAYLQRARQYEDAKTRVSAVVAAAPANVDARIALGNALAGLRDFDGAVNQLDEAIRLDPKRQRGLCESRSTQGDTRAARPCQDRVRAGRQERRSLGDRAACAGRLPVGARRSEGGRGHAEAGARDRCQRPDHQSRTRDVVSRHPTDGQGGRVFADARHAEQDASIATGSRGLLRRAPSGPTTRARCSNRCGNSARLLWWPARGSPRSSTRPVAATSRIR